MRTPYTLRDTSVLYEGRDELRHVEVSTAVLHALRRKLRLARYDKDFFKNLLENGEASVSWNLTRYNTEHDEQWVSFHAWTLENGLHQLNCIGPQAETVIDRINKALFDKTPKWLKKQIKKEDRHRTKSRRFRLRKAKRLKKGPSPLQIKRPKKQKRFTVSNDLINLTPQFHKTRIFWNEAIDATVAIFGIKRDAQFSARHIAARRLYQVLDRTDYAFAQYREKGFCLQFTAVDGRWKGMDLTAVTVSCTKDNRHPIYRRMRKWLRKHAQGIPEPLAARRRALLYDPSVSIAA